MLIFSRTITFATTLLLAPLLVTMLAAGEPKTKIDLKTRDKEKPTFVLVYGDTDGCKETIRAMEKVAKKYDIRIESWKFGVVDEERFKYDVLLRISVSQRIKIHQSNKAKQLYPHLVIYLKGKPLTYYPQARKGETTVTIDSFLMKLQEGKFVGIESVGELQRHLRKKQSTNSSCKVRESTDVFQRFFEVRHPNFATTDKAIGSVACPPTDVSTTPGTESDIPLSAIGVWGQVEQQSRSDAVRQSHGTQKGEIARQ